MTPIQRTAAIGAVSILASLLGACGKPDPAPTATPRPSANAVKAGNEKPQEGASAEEVAKQARGDLRCPAKISTPAREPRSPVDDVLGVRPGLSYEEAMNAVLCVNDLLVASNASGRGFTLKAAQAQSVRQGFVARNAEPRVVKTSKQIMKEMQDDAIARGGNAVREDLKPGQSKWFVSTMGLQGRERVIGVAREERYAPEQTPTVEAVHAALLKKYGSPTRDQSGSGGQLPVIRWAYDPLGRLVTESSPLFNRCHGTSDPNGGANLTPDCGIVVQALLIPQKANPELVDRLQVGVIDQAGGYRLIGETEQGLGQMDQQRRAQEVDKAVKNTKAPSL